MDIPCRLVMENENLESFPMVSGSKMLLHGMLCNYCTHPCQNLTHYFKLELKAKLNPVQSNLTAYVVLTQKQTVK